MVNKEIKKRQESLSILYDLTHIPPTFVTWNFTAYSEDEDEGELLFDALEQPDNTECMTLDQEPGVCVTLRRCHPILFGDNGEVRNPSLAHEYSQNVDACGSLNALEDEPVNVQPEFPKPIPSKC